MTTKPLTDEQIETILNLTRFTASACFNPGGTEWNCIIARAFLREAARIADDGLEGTTGLARMCVERVRNNIRRASGDQ